MLFATSTSQSSWPARTQHVAVDKGLQCMWATRHMQRYRPTTCREEAGLPSLSATVMTVISISVPPSQLLAPGLCAPSPRASGVDPDFGKGGLACHRHAVCRRHTTRHRRVRRGGGHASQENVDFWSPFPAFWWHLEGILMIIFHVVFMQIS